MLRQWRRAGRGRRRLTPIGDLRSVMLLVTAAAQAVLLGFRKRPDRVRPPGGARGAGVPHRAGMAVSRASVPAHDLHRDTVVRPLPGTQARQGVVDRLIAPGGSILDQLLRFPLIAAVGLLGAEVLRHLVEQPIIRLGRRLPSLDRSGRRTPELEPRRGPARAPGGATTKAQRMTAMAEPDPECDPSRKHRGHAGTNPRADAS